MPCAATASTSDTPVCPFSGAAKFTAALGEGPRVHVNLPGLLTGPKHRQRSKAKSLYNTDWQVWTFVVLVEYQR